MRRGIATQYSLGQTVLAEASSTSILVKHPARICRKPHLRLCRTNPTPPRSACCWIQQQKPKTLLSYKVGLSRILPNQIEPRSLNFGLEGGAWLTNSDSWECLVRIVTEDTSPSIISIPTTCFAGYLAHVSPFSILHDVQLHDSCKRVTT